MTPVDLVLDPVTGTRGSGTGGAENRPGGVNTTAAATSQPGSTAEAGGRLGPLAERRPKNSRALISECDAHVWLPSFLQISFSAVSHPLSLLPATAHSHHLGLRGGRQRGGDHGDRLLRQVSPLTKCWPQVRPFGLGLVSHSFSLFGLAAPPAGCRGSHV